MLTTVDIVIIAGIHITYLLILKIAGSFIIRFDNISVTGISNRN